MNEKEVAEIRRRFKPERNSITHVSGCYVNENKEIVTQFDQSLTMLSQEECDMVLSTLRRTLSGGLGKNMNDIVFSTQQVAGSEEHELLMALRGTSRTAEHTLLEFYSRVIATVELDSSYLILLAGDAYDVPYRSSDGEKQHDASSEVYSYVLCAICPVKLTKPALSFRAHENQFSHMGVDWAVSAPELGFLFPAFNDRSTDLYGALYYSRDLTGAHQGFVDAVFHAAPPMPPETQKETFQALLSDSLGEECSLEVVQSVQEQLCGLMAEHKESRDAQPLMLSKGAVKQVLAASGVSQSRLTTFEGQYESEFGGDTALSPRNLVDPKQLEICTPDVTIRVSAERADLVETRVINGTKYILIRAGDGVAVNGVNVNII